MLPVSLLALFACNDPSGPNTPGPTPGESADTEGPSETELASSESPLVVITAPNWGYDLATDSAAVTLEGVSREDVVSVS